MEVFIIVVIAVVMIVAAAFAFYQFLFLRRPARQIPYGNSVVSPANGVIGRIEKISRKTTTIDKGILGQIRTSGKKIGSEFLLILIVMNVWHVHYQRAPVSGIVRSVRHKKGSFKNAVAGARTLRAFENEHCEILFEQDNKDKVKMIQIAGFLARRIVSFVKKDEVVIKGQHVGLIKLGSQVALLMPSTYTVKVTEGDNVIDGSTIIAQP